MRNRSTIQAVVTAAQKAELEHIASSHGMSISTFTRNLITKALSLDDDINPRASLHGDSPQTNCPPTLAVGGCLSCEDE